MSQRDMHDFTMTRNAVQGLRITELGFKDQLPMFITQKVIFYERQTAQFRPCL